MKIFVVLCGVFSVAYCGVGIVTPEIEMEALRLWQAHCEGASEGGVDGGNYIFCKKSQETIEENLTHQHTLTGGAATKDQIVFVQQPSYHYKHNILVNGLAGSPPKTVIYVKQPKHSHQINVQDQTIADGKPPKPTLYFLKSNHGEEQATAATTTAGDEYLA